MNKKPTVAEVLAGLDAEVAMMEAKFGPQVSGRLTGRGRPKKGTQVEPTVPHSIRIQPSVWELMKDRASALGISTNAAFQLAAKDWSRKPQPR